MPKGSLIVLKASAFDYKLNNTIGDEMFMNGSFLVSKGREKEFDNVMEEVRRRIQRKNAVFVRGTFAPL